MKGPVSLSVGITSTSLMMENTWEPSLLPGRSFVQRALSNGTFRGLRQNLWSLQSTRFVFWPRSWDWRRIMMSMSLKKTKSSRSCVSQQEVVEEVAAKQQSSGAIREMLKAWDTVESNGEKHHPNRAVATNLFNDNAVSQFR
ncbi:hypothetical protein AVEN_198444-1 [Araneus ventricosus]|uniref:Uncharacterized protein n=1 Tax=Araneus ventricosus TaxID=182803 RepID=A0A4Y2V608_ARAVE|nr:hypothetical protein AVEN_198444-1 [Araneus ventricosus]